MPDIPTIEPLSFCAGDKVQWKKSFSDYPASDSYELKYYLVKSNNQITVTAAADGDDHLVTITAADSANYAAGRYFYQARIEKGTDEKYTVGEGVIEIKPNLSAQSSGYEWREHCEQALANIEAILLNKGTHDNFSYSIAGRSLSKYSWSELKEMRDYYKAELVRFDRKHGLKRKQKIQVQFS